MFNELIKDCTPIFLTSLVAHLINCLLGPEDLLKALNNRKIKPESVYYPDI